MKTSSAIGLLAVFLMGVGAAGSPAGKTGSGITVKAFQTDDPFVGNQMCVRCHEDVQTALVEVPHGHGNATEIAENGCQSCHGPGRAHVQNPTAEDRQPRIDRMTIEQRTQLCAQCHGDMPPFDTTHTQETVSCSGCHVLHVRDADAGILAWQGSCLSCHRGKTSFDELHAYDMADMAAGKVSCRSCHQQSHGS